MSNWVKKLQAKQSPEQLALTMDYLLSLVGKDKETILDAMKEMVENVDKVKNEDVEKNCELESHFGRNFACKECCKTFGSRVDLKKNCSCYAQNEDETA